MNAPSMPWKKEAAIGGAVTIRTVRINPSPPCCNAMLLMPSVVAPVNLPTQKAAATASTILDRKSVVEGKSVSVRVDLGGPRILKNKKKTTTTHNHETK